MKHYVFLLMGVWWSCQGHVTPFEDLVLEYGYITEDFAQRLRAADSDHAHAAWYGQLDTRMEHLRQVYYEQGDEHTAFEVLFTHIIDDCNTWNLKHHVFIPYHKSTNAADILPPRYAYAHQALGALCAWYTSWQKPLSLSQKIQNVVLYNFFSTHVVPQCVYGLGWVCSCWYTMSLMKQWVEQARVKAAQYDAMDAIKTEFEKGVEYNAYTDHPSWPRDSAGNSVGDDRVNLLEYADGSRSLGMTGLFAMSARGMAHGVRIGAPIFVGAYARDMIRDFQQPRYQERLKNEALEREKRAAHEEHTSISVHYERDLSLHALVGLDDRIRANLLLLVDYLQHPFKYQHVAPGMHTILLYGPPGNGKTIASRALAYESGAPYIEMNADDLLHVDAKQRIAKIMDIAYHVAAQRPEKSVIVYLDEIDCLVANRAHDGLDPARAKALAQVLAFLDGINKHNPYIHVLVIITTNHLDRLDEALVRPGRIHQKIYVGPPGPDARRALLASLEPFTDDFLEYLVTKTDGMSYAELVGMVRAVKMRVAYQGGSGALRAEYEKFLAGDGR